MTQAQWAATIEPQGTLTNMMASGHIDAALADIDPAIGASLLGGTAITLSQAQAREELFLMRTFYFSNGVTNPSSPGNLLSAAARTTLLNRGQAGYAAAGLP